MMALTSGQRCLYFSRDAVMRREGDQGEIEQKVWKDSGAAAGADHDAVLCGGSAGG